ncbi:MAG: DUF3120 domain-containing protein [Leptolyngbyaceae bacterium]|nr:DUF3120 domain-containing protein [Leptolyngbyaceae bacterium]
MVAVSVLLVCVPVLFQAPLVRTLPWVSFVATFVWWAGAIALNKHQSTAHWGDLLMGFTWTWLAGTIYWGWFRWEPLLHLPIECIGVPFAIWALRRDQGKIGHWFYLGSLFGTAITDVYFYLVRLLPYWRQVMQVPPTEARAILHQALLLVETSWGYTYAILLVGILLGVGCLPLKLGQLHWYAFGGAVLSTLLVDGLFLIAAILA